MKNKNSTIKFVFFAALVFIFACNKIVNVKESLPENNPENMSSVRYEDGRYLINMSVLNNNGHKEKLVSKLCKVKLEEKKTVGEIPEFIKTFMCSLPGDRTFNIANPNEDWLFYDITAFSKGEMIDFEKRVGLPNKQLIYFSVGKNYALLSYRTGGLRMLQNISVIEFKDNKVTDFWEECDNTYFTSEDQIKKYIKERRADGC